MPSKSEIIDQARAIGFAGIGFTGIEPFSSQQQILQERSECYRWTLDKGMNLDEGIDPVSIMPDAKTIIVVLENYYRSAFPSSMVGKFGRCYQDDDRVTKDGLAIKIKQFRNYLKEHGIQSKVRRKYRTDWQLPGLAWVRSAKIVYSLECSTARQSSWVLPVAILIDQEFSPDVPSIEVNCPKWCRNACIASCPTGALLGPNKIDPQRCISFLTYYGEGLTPRELREPMGMWVYGCDRCQNVCPRNEPWLNPELRKTNKPVKKRPVLICRGVCSIWTRNILNKIYHRICFICLPVTFGAGK